MLDREKIYKALDLTEQQVAKAEKYFADVTAFGTAFGMVVTSEEQQKNRSRSTIEFVQYMEDVCAQKGAKGFVAVFFGDYACRVTSGGKLNEAELYGAAELLRKQAQEHCRSIDMICEKAAEAKIQEEEKFNACAEEKPH